MAGKRFTQVLAEIRGGSAEALASTKLDELIKAIQIAGKSGKLTIELTLEPHGQANREIYVSAKVKMTAPADPNAVEPSIFFVNRDGDLVRDDPDQPKLPFRGGGGSHGEVMRVGGGGKADGRSPAEQGMVG